MVRRKLSQNPLSGFPRRQISARVCKNRTTNRQIVVDVSLMPGAIGDNLLVVSSITNELRVGFHLHMILYRGRAQLADTLFTKVGDEQHVHCGNNRKPATLTIHRL